MAEMAVRVVDKINNVSTTDDLQCLKRGHIVDIKPDGHPWSAAELSGAEWRIVYMPGVPVEQVDWMRQGPDDLTLGRRNTKMDVTTWASNSYPSCTVLGLVQMSVPAQVRSYLLRRLRAMECVR